MLSGLRRILRSFLRPRKKVDVVIAYYGETRQLKQYISFLNEFPNVTLYLYDKKNESIISNIWASARFETKIIPEAKNDKDGKFQFTNKKISS